MSLLWSNLCVIVFFQAFSLRSGRLPTRAPALPVVVGGASDRLTVVPVIPGTTSARASTSQEQFRAQLMNFDVAQAQCAKDEDTQRLLACIEVGFGTCEPSWI